MSRRSIDQAPFDGAVHRAARGPNGRRLCRWCGAEVPPRRINWCGDACVQEFVIRKGGAQMVAIVFRRDNGVCARCGIDTEALKQIFREAQRRAGDCAIAASRARMGFRETGELYDVDHIIPVVEGGGGCGLENLRTLCTPCHKAVTAEMHARRAAERRRDVQRAEPGMQSLLPGVGPV